MLLPLREKNGFIQMNSNKKTVKIRENQMQVIEAINKRKQFDPKVADVMIDLIKNDKLNID